MSRRDNPYPEDTTLDVSNVNLDCTFANRPTPTMPRTRLFGIAVSFLMHLTAESAGDSVGQRSLTAEYSDANWPYLCGPACVILLGIRGTIVGNAFPDLAEIYDTHAPKIFRYLYHRLGDQALAEDLTSEVFVRFLHARPAPDNLLAFLYRMAHNLFVDYLRRNPPLQQLDENIPADGNDPTHLAEIEMERMRLRRALLRLTAEQQQVIVLKFLEGLSNEEIARVVGKPVGAVKALQHRGLGTLRNLLSSQVRLDWQLEQAGE